MSTERVPMRWPAEWTDPARLELLEGTPINCLVGDEPPPFPLGDIEFLTLDGENPPDGVTLREGIWPTVQAGEGGGQDDAEAGPTGAPWVDSNAWVVRLAQAKEPGKKVWLDYAPPSGSEVVPLNVLPRPVAEAEAYGAHWIITLTDHFRQGIENRDADALETWKKMMAVLEFSAEHAEWREWEPVAALAVVSNFEFENEFLAGEFLNLAPRNHLAHRIVLAGEAANASYSDQKAILYIDVNPPEGELWNTFRGFAESGGLVILPMLPGDLGEPTGEQKGYDIFTVGKGRVATPREEWYDPWVLAEEVQLLLSHREDVVRIWNGGSMNSHYVASPDKSKGVVHLVNYGGGANPLEAVTLGFAEEYQSARVFTIDSVKTVKPVQARLGTEVPIPPFTLYAAVELGG